MPTQVLMPALSPTMEEGKLAKWVKAEGDEVHSGDVIAEIETDKATMEVEAVDEGKIEENSGSGRHRGREGEHPDCGHRHRWGRCVRPRERGRGQTQWRPHPAAPPAPVAGGDASEPRATVDVRVQDSGGTGVLPVMTALSKSLKTQRRSR